MYVNENALISYPNTHVMTFMYFIQSFALHCVTPLNRTFLTRAEENRFFIVQMKYKTFDSTYGFQFIYIVTEHLYSEGKH